MWLQNNNIPLQYGPGRGRGDRFFEMGKGGVVRLQHSAHKRARFEFVYVCECLMNKQSNEAGIKQ
jgi:hypothetical protein